MTVQRAVDYKDIELISKFPLLSVIVGTKSYWPFYCEQRRVNTTGTNARRLINTFFRKECGEGPNDKHYLIAQEKSYGLCIELSDYSADDSGWFDRQLKIPKKLKICLSEKLDLYNFQEEKYLRFYDGDPFIDIFLDLDPVARLFLDIGIKNIGHAKGIYYVTYNEFVIISRFKSDIPVKNLSVLEYIPKKISGTIVCPDDLSPEGSIYVNQHSPLSIKKLSKKPTLDDFCRI